MVLNIKQKKGMTWEEFIYSEHNISGYFTYSNDSVEYNGNKLKDEELMIVNITFLIEENGSYSYTPISVSAD